MDAPNVDKSWMDFIQDILTQKILTGNAFAAWDLGTGVNEGKPFHVYSLPSTEMQIILGDDLRSIAGYNLDFAWSEAEVVPASDVLHIKAPNPDYDTEGDWLFGQSPCLEPLDALYRRIMIVWTLEYGSYRIRAHRSSYTTRMLIWN